MDSQPRSQQLNIEQIFFLKNKFFTQGYQDHPTSEVTFEVTNVFLRIPRSFSDLLAFWKSVFPVLGLFGLYQRFF